ncbi:MAG: hypothetical protein M1817_005788 [Caeruleum heppii]|nr:MAG: hypothetical protein M1817_005788 [Caeruleum heppii]
MTDSQQAPLPAEMANSPLIDTADPPPPAPPSKAGKPSSAAQLDRLKPWIHLYLHKTDTTISHLNRILSTPTGLDTTLSLLSYSTLLLSTLINRLTLTRLHNAAAELTSKAATTLLPGETLIAQLSLPSGYAALARRGAQLKALAALVSDVRIFLRLWGLLGIWTWGRDTWRAPPRDGILRSIAYAQVFVNMFYQFLENGAYLGQHGVVSWSTTTQSRAWAWSSRFWACHVALDLGRLFRERHLRLSQTTQEDSTTHSERSEKHVDEKEKEVEANTRESQTFWDRWNRELLVNVAFAPLTLHWSLEEGLVGDGVVGALGSVAGVVGFREMWRRTA